MPVSWAPLPHPYLRLSLLFPLTLHSAHDTLAPFVVTPPDARTTRRHNVRHCRAAIEVVHDRQQGDVRQQRLKNSGGSLLPDPEFAHRQVYSSSSPPSPSKERIASPMVSVTTEEEAAGRVPLEVHPRVRPASHCRAEQEIIRTRKKRNQCCGCCCELTKMGDALNQGRFGSCVCHALVTVIYE